MDAAVKSVLLTVITLAATRMEAVAVALEVVSIDYLGP
jgi:hypothetical protein